MFRNLTCLGIKHIKKSVTTKRLEKCLCSKHIFYSVQYVSAIVFSIYYTLWLQILVATKQLISDKLQNVVDAWAHACVCGIFDE